MDFSDAGADKAESDERFRRLEARLANLETIIIERDKKSEFERALK